MECFSCKESLTFKPGGLGFQDSPPWLRLDLIHLTPGSVVSLPGRLLLFPLAHTHLLRATGRCPMVSWFAFLHSLLQLAGGILQESSGARWNPQKVLLSRRSAEQPAGVSSSSALGPRQGTEPTKELAWGRHQLFESLKRGLRNRSTLRPSTEGKGDGVLQTGHTDPFLEWILALHTRTGLLLLLFGWY